MWPTLEIDDTWRIAGGLDSTLLLQGLRIAGSALEIDTDGPKTLVIRDCTLVPGQALNRAGEPQAAAKPSLIVRKDGARLIIDRSIIGAIQVAPGVQLEIVDSIIDAPDLEVFALAGIAGTAGVLRAERSTFIGDVAVEVIDEVSDCLFASRPGRVAKTPPVRAMRLQEGCIRFSALPPGSSVPGCYRCYPPQDDSGAPGPVFGSLRYGDADYARLLQVAPEAILLGAEHGREMGVMNRESWTKRRVALAQDLPEWTPFGMIAGVEIMVE